MKNYRIASIPKAYLLKRASVNNLYRKGQGKSTFNRGRVQLYTHKIEDG